MIPLPPMLATALPARPALLETLSYQAVGLLVVFIALGSIWLSMELLGAIFRRMPASPVPVAPPPPSPEPSPTSPLPEPEPVVMASAPGEMSPDLRVAIFAAVTLVLEQPVRVISCVERQEAHPSEFNIQMLAYASDGRRRQLDSHRPR